jgi:predicted XRE-type DNA-binding protein
MPNREFTPSSGNVFADLNLPHADDLLANAELATKIIDEIQRRRLTQSQAALMLGIDQPKISALKSRLQSGSFGGSTSRKRIRRLMEYPDSLPCFNAEIFGWLKTQHCCKLGFESAAAAVFSLMVLAASSAFANRSPA